MDWRGLQYFARRHLGHELVAEHPPVTAELIGFAAGLVISVITTPVGVSGAVFLLPVQVSWLNVPSPSVTPTNLLYNVVAGPGALLRYRQHGRLGGPLTRLMLSGTLPGVIIGAVIRVFAVPGPDIFRLLVATLLLPLGIWLCVRTVRPHRSSAPRPPSNRAIVALAGIVGVVGGIYGIGGGAILGPILAGRGIPLHNVAPAALTSTFVTSLVGATTFTTLAFTTGGTVAPDWTLGLACGFGGLCGGYIGARLQPHVPEASLRFLLGILAIAVGGIYAVQALI